MQKNNDLISIIIPVYNAEKYISETLDTVVNQTYSNWELILIDDFSNDNSVSIIKKRQQEEKRIKLYSMNKNVGQAVARNNGIERAKGKFICFLDADDKWEKEKLEKQIQFMKEKKCAFSYTSYEFADEKCNPNGKKVIAKETLSYKEALKNNIISTITVMFDLDKISKNEIIMPNLKYVEDTATWWKILRNGYTAYGKSDIYSYYRRSPKTSSSNKFRTQKPLWNLYRNVEKLGVFYSFYCLTWKNIHALLRRI